jgi:MATE family multidrug resistance protein
MILGICALALNIPLNYLFIYGHLGIPAMGGPGCGLTTALTTWLLLLGMTGWIRRAPVYHPSALFARMELPRWAVIKRLLSIGLPIGITLFAQASIYAVIALLIASLGANVVAGHQIALNFSSLLFMVPYALGTAIAVSIGQAMGRGEPRDARMIAGIGIATALAYASLSASSILLLRSCIPMIYTTDPAVIELAAALLMFAALYQFSEGLQVTAAAALRGYQDTRITMIMTVLAGWCIGLPVGYVLGLTDWLGEPSGPAGLWQGLIVGLTCAALMLGFRLNRIARKYIATDRA